MRQLRELRRQRGDRGSIIVLASIDSTNRLARRIATECVEQCGDMPPVPIIAYEQTDGRGRRGNHWSSPAGLGVYATFILCVADIETLSSLPVRASVALCAAIGRHLNRGAPCRLKWPNDLMVGRNKIGGLLIETVVQGNDVQAAAVGFGVNHGHDRSRLPNSAATSLRLECDQPPSLAEFSLDLIDAVHHALIEDDTPLATIAETYRGLSIHRVGDRLRCRLPDRVIEGTLLGFDEAGHLRLESGGDEIHLTAGEVIEG